MNLIPIGNVNSVTQRSVTVMYGDDQVDITWLVGFAENTYYDARLQIHGTNPRYYLMYWDHGFDPALHDALESYLVDPEKPKPEDVEVIIACLKLAVPGYHDKAAPRRT